MSPSRSSQKATQRRRAVLAYSAMALLAWFFFFPMWLMIVTAFKGNDPGGGNSETQLLRELSGLRAFLPNANMGIDNFADMMRRLNYWQAFFNSSLVVSCIVLLGLVVNSSFAYALARLNFPGRAALLLLVIALIIVPAQVLAVPLLLMVNQLGWLNTYHVQIIPSVASAFSVYLFYQFFVGFPKELEEAAIVDGANRYQIYWRVVLPLSGPVFATVAVLSFLAAWGSLFWQVLTVQDLQFATLPLAMQSFFGQPDQRRWGDIMAFALSATLPAIVLFLAFQRYFVRSIASSGVKG
jgi:multiple sugar transport system permease protein